MSCGLPVIGTDSPGIKELIDHGVNGYLCGTDSESIENAIEELISRPKLRKKLGRNARQFTVENFSLDRIVEMELELYREILERKKHQLS
jgi:glycosyltransferase involved in cell wall biosynthesis